MYPSLGYIVSMTREPPFRAPSHIGASVHRRDGGQATSSSGLENLLFARLHKSMQVSMVVMADTLLVVVCRRSKK